MNTRLLKFTETVRNSRTDQANGWLILKSVVASTLFGLIFCGVLGAQDTFTWNGNGPDSDWTTVANWEGNSPPANLNSSQVVFGPNTNNKTNQDIANPLTLNSIRFDPGSGNVTVDGSRLVLDDFQGNVPTLTHNNNVVGSSFISIDSNITLGDTVVINGSSNTGTLRLNGVLSGTEGVVFNPGNGLLKLRLNGLSSFSGGFTQQGGRVIVGTSSDAEDPFKGPLGKGTFTFNAGTFSSPTAVNNPLKVNLRNNMHLGAAVQFGDALDPGRFDVAFSGDTFFTQSNTFLTVNNLGIVRLNGRTQEVNPTLTTNLLKLRDGTLVIGKSGKLTIKGQLGIAAGKIIVEKDGQLGELGKRIPLIDVNPNLGPATMIKPEIGGTGKIFVNDLRVRKNGRLRPGNSPGILSVDGGVTLEPDSFFSVDLGGDTAGNESFNHAQLHLLDGFVDLTGSILDASLSYAPHPDDILVVIKNDATNSNSTTGFFSQGSSVLIPFGSDTYQFDITYDANVVGSQVDLHGGNDVALFNAQIVPEPASGLLLVLVFAMHIAITKRKRDH